MFFVCDGNHRLKAWTGLIRGCIVVTAVGTTQWIAFALMQEAREAYS
jgi:hypothetical protein